MTDEPLPAPCPFCSSKLWRWPGGSLWQHPEASCPLSGLMFDERDCPDFMSFWNRRSAGSVREALAALKLAQDMAVKLSNESGRTIGHPHFIGQNHPGWVRIADTIDRLERALRGPGGGE